MPNFNFSHRQLKTLVSSSFIYWTQWHMLCSWPSYSYIAKWPASLFVKSNFSQAALAWSCDRDGPPVHITASTVLISSEDSWKDQVSQGQTAENQSRTTYKDWPHLGRGRGSGCQHTRLASECGPMCPHGNELNQGQGQGQISVWTRTL